ncbi:MAG: hypothetical protein IT267_03870 [Saprospiraceae bacterium]|nr:hypothetical protein [Saprospiraceae bacterium]
MKSLLLTTKLVLLLIFLNSCNNKINNDNPADKEKKNKTNMNNTNSKSTDGNSMNPNRTNSESSGTTKDSLVIHSHGDPNQQYIDSIKEANYKAKKRK